jgi:hypothetical protein
MAISTVAPLTEAYSADAPLDEEEEAIVLRKDLPVSAALADEGAEADGDESDGDEVLVVHD